MDAAEAIGWLGGALIVGRLVPQALRLARTGATAGVSSVGAWCWVGNDVGWLTYGVRAGLAPLWVPSVALLVLDLAVVAMLLRATTGRQLATGVAWVVAVAAAALAGQQALAVALVAGSATGTLPHGWRALRSADLSGVAPATWALAVADGLVWGVYGLARRDLAVTWYAALTLVTGAVVLWRIRTTRAAPPSPPAWHPA